MNSYFENSRLGRLLCKLSGGYNYNVSADYSYDLEKVADHVESVELLDGHVTFPEFDDGFDSGFLKVEVVSTTSGKLSLPFVEMVSGELSEIQYLERGCRGIRYINISAFLELGVESISICGKHVNIKSKTELVLFRNEIPENPTVLVLAPHPDDAEIAAYGFYSDLKNTYIVTITAGDGGTSNYNRIYSNKAEHFLKKGKLRTWNSIAVPMLCGIPPERSISLGFFEGRLKEMFQDRDAAVCGIFSGVGDINTYRKQNLSSLAEELDGGATWNDLVANLRRLLMRIEPDIIVTPHPVLDVQEDHRFASMAVFEALRLSGLSDGGFYCYVNHIRYNHLYPYGSMSSVVSLSPNFSENPYFTSIHSHRLSLSEQRDKMFSLEAMNDLRLNTDRRFSKEATMTALKAPLKAALGYDDSYYRRAVRSNELFYVVEFSVVHDDRKLALLTDMNGY